MLAFVEQLSEVDVAGVEPMTSVTPMDMKKRADVVNDGEIADEVVRNAPETRTISFWCRKSSNKFSTREIRCACFATMKGLRGVHELSRRHGAPGKVADPDKAMDAVLDALEASDKTRAKQDDPANDKTLSPFFCSPVDK